MILIGITGGIGHGKSVLAADFGRLEPRSLHLETSSIIAEVVTTWQHGRTTLPHTDDIAGINAWLRDLPAAANTVLHDDISFELLHLDNKDVARQPELYSKLFTYLNQVDANPALLHSAITKENKNSYRAILQWLGSYLVAKVDLQIWYRELVRQATEAGKHGVVLCTIGGVRFVTDADTVRSAQGRIVHIVRPDMEEADMADPTERERNRIAADITVINDGSLMELLACAETIYRDLHEDRVESRYVASEFGEHAYAS